MVVQAINHSRSVTTTGISASRVAAVNINAIRPRAARFRSQYLLAITMLQAATWAGE